MKKRIKIDDDVPKVGPKKKSPSHVYKPKDDPTPPVARSKGPRPIYNWTMIRNDYVEGVLRDNPRDEFDRVFPTYEQLAQKYGVALSTVRARGSRERWKNLKNQYAIDLAQSRQKKRANKLANAAVQFDDNTLKVGELGVTLVMSRLAEVAKEMQVRNKLREDALNRMDAGEHVDAKELRSAVYHQEMLALANAAEKFQSIGMRALGTSSEVNNNVNIQVGDTNVGNTVNVSQELIRDDKERASALVSAFVEAGVVGRSFIDAITVQDDEEKRAVIQGEIVPPSKADELNAEAPEATESIPSAEDVEDDSYETDPEILKLIQSMPTVKSSELDPRMKEVSSDDDDSIEYGGSDYDLDMGNPELYSDEEEGA